MSDVAAPAHEELGRRVEQMLSKILFVGYSRIRDASAGPPSPETILEHVSYVVDLERRGILFAAGPFVTPEGAPAGDALLIVRAEDEDQAREFFSADPLIKSGFRTVEVHRWQVHEGQLTISVNFSDQTYHLA
jgi:uncharacterized protein